jgi:FkbH-like protein
MVVEFNAPDSRMLELVNKTNQFNLNGCRKTEAEWQKELDEPGAFSIAVSYEDKYGPLGKIAVIQGAHHDRVVEVSTWVMSCRAFSRRIEHRCLEILIDRFGARELRFQFAPTPKNDPVSAFFRPYLNAKPEGPFSLDPERFLAVLPRLYHQVEYANG